MPALPQSLRDALAALGRDFAAYEDAPDDPPPADPPPKPDPPPADPPPADPPPGDPPPDEPPTPAHWLERRWGAK